MNHVRGSFEASIAVKQVNDSKIDYATSVYLSNHFVDFVHILLIFLILFIWKKEIKNILLKTINYIKEIGAVTNNLTTIIGYYFGSSKSADEKTKIISESITKKEKENG